MMKSVQLSASMTLGSFLMLVTLVGCGPQNGGSSSTTALTALPAPAIDQESICETSNVGIATDCKVGQKIAFLPRSFGNEQLPVLFAAANCDLRYSVVATVGAVTCIYNPIKPRSQPASPPTPPASAASQ